MIPPSTNIKKLASMYLSVRIYIKVQCYDKIQINKFNDAPHNGEGTKAKKSASDLAIIWCSAKNFTLLRQSHQNKTLHAQHWC